MLLQGDCLTQLQNLEASSVDSIVTDPPYGLGFMGKQWDSLPPGQGVFEQCLRVLKPGGHLCCFGGSRTYHRMAVAVEDAGFEIRDQIMWVYGSGFPKSQDISKEIDKKSNAERKTIKADKAKDDPRWKANSNSKIFDPKEGWNNHSMDQVGKKSKARYIMEPATKDAKQWEGYGTALKPAHEPIVLARKPIEKGLSIAQNCLKWGVGAINVDGCRVELNGDKKISGGCQAKSGAASVLASLEKNPNKENNSKGRFPANLIHDGSDEVLGLFPVTKSHGGGKASYGGEFGNGQQVSDTDAMNRFAGDTGSAARFFYTAKANKKERLTFNNHPTVKPVSLMQYLVRLITPEGGTCLDPFAGSGTTGLACMKEGRGYILIDADSQSLDIARRRLLSEIASQEWPLRKYHLL